MLTPRSPNNSPPQPPTSPALGKNYPAPPRTSVLIQFATKQRRAARLGLLGPCDAGKSQERSQHQPHLAGDASDGHTGRGSYKSHRQNTAGQAARDGGRRKSGPGVRCRAPGYVSLDVGSIPLLAQGGWQGVGGTAVAQQGSAIWVTAHRFGLSPHPSPGAY